MNWPTTRLRYVADLNPAVRQDLVADRDTEVSFLPMEAIGEDGSLNLERVRAVSEVRNGYSYFEDGDVAFAKVTPCFENGKGALMRGLQLGAGFGTSELTVLRPKGDTYARFLNYVVQSQQFRQDGAGAMTGAGGLKRVPDDFTRNFKTPWPSRSEQERIANFLDEQTARIDALIAEKERLLSRLDEMRWARVAEELLNRPHDASKPIRLRYLVKSCQNGLWGDEPTEDGNNVVVVRVADFDKKNRRISLDNPTYRHIEQDKLPSRLLQRGDLLIEKSGGGPTTPVGNVVMFNDDVPAICSNFVARMPVEHGNDPGFVCLLFQALYALGKNVPHIKQTSGIQNLDADSYLSQTVLVPPLEQQKRLARNILMTFEAMESLEQISMAAVEHLREYRSSLISAAVTGQMDISTYKPH